MLLLLLPLTPSMTLMMHVAAMLPGAFMHLMDLQRMDASMQRRAPWAEEDPWVMDRMVVDAMVLSDLLLAEEEEEWGSDYSEADN